MRDSGNVRYDEGYRTVARRELYERGVRARSEGEEDGDHQEAVRRIRVPAPGGNSSRRLRRCGRRCAGAGRSLTTGSTGRAISVPLFDGGSCAPVNLSVRFLLSGQALRSLLRAKIGVGKGGRSCVVFRSRLLLSRTRISSPVALTGASFSYTAW